MAILQQLARSGVGIANLDIDNLIDSSTRKQSMNRKGADNDASHTDDDIVEEDDGAAQELEDLLTDAFPHSKVSGKSKSGHHPLYDALVTSVERQIRQLKVVLESAEAKEKEREYVRVSPAVTVPCE